jgi:hypothetical protein
MRVDDLLGAAPAESIFETNDEAPGEDGHDKSGGDSLSTAYGVLGCVSMWSDGSTMSDGMKVELCGSMGCMDDCDGVMSIKSIRKRLRQFKIYTAFRLITIDSSAKWGDMHTKSKVRDKPAADLNSNAGVREKHAHPPAASAGRNQTCQLCMSGRKLGQSSQGAMCRVGNRCKRVLICGAGSADLVGFRAKCDPL